MRRESSLGDRVERYVERWFQRSGKTEFPTARQVAKAMRCRIADILELADGDHENLQRTHFSVNYRVPPGDWFIETVSPPTGVRQWLTGRTS